MAHQFSPDRGRVSAPRSYKRTRRTARMSPLQLAAHRVDLKWNAYLAMAKAEITDEVIAAMVARISKHLADRDRPAVEPFELVAA